MAFVLAFVLMFAACTAGGGEAPAPEPAPAPVETDTGGDAPAPAAAENPNLPDYTWVLDEGTIFDIQTYYNSLDPALECETTIRNGGAVNVPDNNTTPMPKATEKYTIGFSVYYTVDEVGGMLVDTMKAAAADAGVELLLNDANYDQNAQNQAIEQWITQGVDGVILAPCDFHGVKEALDMLKEAGIPVVTLNAPLAGETDSIVMSDCLDQGDRAGKLLVDALKAEGKDIAGKIIYQTLPFVHPNAVLRVQGFKDAFKTYPDAEFIELTGISPEDHYTAFEGALMAHSDMIGAYGIYSSAVIGMENAKKAAGSDVLLTAIDNDKIILAGIYEGSIIGSACYSSIAPAWWCMTLIVNKLNGAPIPGVVFYENKTVTKDNVEAMFEHYYPGQTLQGFMSGQ
jgi:ribose transport system substrate-binding protein